MTDNEKLVWAAAFTQLLSIHGTGSERAIGFAVDGACEAVKALRYHTKPTKRDSERMLREMQK